MYYSREEYKALYPDQIAELLKKRQDMGHNPADKKVKFTEGGATVKTAKKLYALVDVMTSAPEAPVTAPTTTNSNNPSLTRQRIICG